MSIILQLRRQLAAATSKFGWAALLLALLVHAGVSYLGLRLFAEAPLTELKTFVYFYLTTALTVGYGDLSPQTAGGRIFVSTWQTRTLLGLKTERQLPLDTTRIKN